VWMNWYCAKFCTIPVRCLRMRETDSMTFTYSPSRARRRSWWMAMNTPVRPQPALSQ
jgi:hypothetical protein